MRILYFGDGPWATRGLERILEEDQEVLGVVLRHQPSYPSLASAAHRYGLGVLQPAKVNEPDFAAKVAELEPELCVSMSYDQILRKPLLDVPRRGFVNFHAGKLPYYRGRNVINWAIINNESSIGLTAHYVDEGIDTGDIIVQHTLPIGWKDSYGDVLELVTNCFPDLIAETVRMIERGCAPRQPQAHLSGTYFSARREGDEWIDWSDTSLNVYNKIRAISHPAPGARTLLHGRVLTVWNACYDPSWPRYIATPGEVVGRAPGGGSTVKTGDSTVLIKSVQLDGEDEQVAKFSIGTRFGADMVGELYRLSKAVSELKESCDR